NVQCPRVASPAPPLRRASGHALSFSAMLSRQTKWALQPRAPVEGKRFAMPYSTLRFEMRGSVAQITLDRPDTLNALSAQMADDLAEAVEACGQQHARAVILTGS